jgi:fructose-bisphosphate aldolase class 1
VTSEASLNADELTVRARAHHKHGARFFKLRAEEPIRRYVETNVIIAAIGYRSHRYRHRIGAIF